MEDHKLLREYVERQSQEAFGRIVERHLPMVYSVARRMVQDAQLAEDVAQTVFTTLARKSESIRPPQVLGGWLYNTARHLAMHAARSEQRRREREQTAVDMQALNSAPDAAPIVEHLEPAMAQLGDEDRDALVLRFLENRTLREVGDELGITEDAARMKVNRALERLRAEFERRGTAVATVLLGSSMTATTSAVPAGFGAAVTATALKAMSVGAPISAAMSLPKLVAAALAGVFGTIAFYQVETARLRTQMQSRQKPDARLVQLQRERDEATTELASVRNQLELSKRDAAELPRLRGEVTRWQREAQELARRPAPAGAPAMNQSRGVAAIVVTNLGAQRVDEERIRSHIHIKVGDLFSRAAIDADVRRLYGTAWFSNVRVLEESNNAGVTLTYVLHSLAQAQIEAEQLVNAGLQSPEAGFQTFLWAARNGDSNLVAQLLRPRWKAPDDAMLPRDLAEQIASAQARGAHKTFSNLARVRILDQRLDDPATARMQVEFTENTGNTRLGEIYMVREGNNWKPALTLSRRTGSTTISGQYFFPTSPELDARD